MLTQEKLNQFTGTERYTNYLCGLKLTDGVRYLAEEGECFWLLDIIASYQPKFHNVPFQLWELEVEETKKEEKQLSICEKIQEKNH